MGQPQFSKRSCRLGRYVPFLAALAAVLVPACGGSSTGPGAITIQQLPGHLANAVCDNIGGCCQAATIAFDLATCKATLTASLNQSFASATGPNVSYDASAAGDCVAAYASQIRSCALEENALNVACGSVFVGKLPPGAACTGSSECRSPPGNHAFCDGQTCALVGGADTSVHGKLGQPCSGTCQTNESCSGTAPSGGTSLPQPTAICYHTDNLYCDAAQTCQPLVAIGAACTSDGCVMGAFCNAGTCVAGLPNGSLCTQDTECVAGSCVFADNGVAEDMPTMGTCGTLAVVNAKTCAGNFQ